MLIRPLSLADRAELLAAHTLQRAAYEIEAGLIGTREIPGLSESLQQLAASAEQFRGAFGDDSGGLVGLIATEDEPGASPGAHPSIRISRLAVSPAAFRRGVGRALVRHVIDSPHCTPPRTLVVSTGAANAPARALYESEGFRLITERTVGRNPPVRIVEYQRGAR